jgi:hypothetical protein
METTIRSAVNNTMSFEEPSVVDRTSPAGVTDDNITVKRKDVVLAGQYKKQISNLFTTASFSEFCRYSLEDDILDPEIKINGYGSVGVPLSFLDITSLNQRFGSSFGTSDQEEPVVLRGNVLKFSNPEWPHVVNDYVRQHRRHLGIGNHHLKGISRKFIRCGPGVEVPNHVMSSKSSAVAQFLVTLPCMAPRPAISLSLDGKTVTVDGDSNASGGVMALWSAGTTCSIERTTQGYFAAILIDFGESGELQQHAPDITFPADRLRGMMDRYFAAYALPTMLAYRLAAPVDGRTPNRLLDALTASDRNLVEHVKQACADQYTIYLAKLERNVFGRRVQQPTPGNKTTYIQGNNFIMEVVEYDSAYSTVEDLQGGLLASNKQYNAEYMVQNDIYREDRKPSKERQSRAPLRGSLDKQVDTVFVYSDIVSLP